MIHRPSAEWLRIAAAVEAFDALSGMEKAERLDAGDPVARFALGHTHDPRAQGYVVGGYIDDHGVATICPSCRNQTLRYDTSEHRWKCPCGYADRLPRW